MQPFPLKTELLEQKTAVALIDAGVAPRDGKRGMVAYIHQKDGGNALLPRVVAIFVSSFPEKCVQQGNTRNIL